MPPQLSDSIRRRGQLERAPGTHNTNLNARLDLKQEKDKLEKQLLSATNAKNRLRELCVILGESSIALDDESAAAE